MPGTARQKRTKRLDVRLSEREARIIRLGAHNRGVKVSNFILESACIRAEQEITETRNFQIDSKTWRQFTQELDRPARVKPRLKRLLAESTVLEHS